MLSQGVEDRQTMPSNSMRKVKATQTPVFLIDFASIVTRNKSISSQSIDRREEVKARMRGGRQAILDVNN
jgi:hypothetical protein